MRRWPNIDPTMELCHLFIGLIVITLVGASRVVLSMPWIVVGLFVLPEKINVFKHNGV